MLGKRFVIATILFITIPAVHLLAHQMSDWWQEYYNRGIEQFKKGNMEDAEHHFRLILSRDETIAEAWYGLGLIEQKLHPDSSSVVQFFDRALDHAPRYAEAYYQLGIYYAHHQQWDKAEKVLTRAVKSDTAHDRAWVKLIQVREQMSQPYPELAAILLPNTIIHNPDKEQLYNIYIHSVLWNSREQEALPTLQILTENNPDNPVHTLDLAYVYYLTGDFEHARAMLGEKARIIDSYSKCKRYLLEAKVLFEQQKDSLGIKRYWQSIKHIADNRDMRIFIDDIRYIIKNNEYQQIKGDSLINLTDFFERFWIARDPNLATEINERIPEHYRRVYFARKNYRRYAPMMFSNEIMYKMEHPYKLIDIKLGDQFLYSMLSEPAQKNLDVDDMGLIYIRLGEADKKLFYQCESCSDNMSWLYYGKNDLSEMIFHFFKMGGFRGWMVETIPHHFEHRWELGNIYNQLDPTVSTTGEPPAYFGNMMYFNELENNNTKYAETAMRVERTGYTYEQELVPIPVKMLHFKTADNKILVELYYILSGKIIPLIDNSLLLSKFLGVYDSTWNQVVRIKKTEKIPLRITQAQWEQSMAVRMERFIIEDMPYHYEFQLEDIRSKRLSVYKGLFIPEHYFSDEFIISDILFSGEIVTGTKNTYYRKGDIIYQPHMFTSFNENDFLGLYFEVYNLFYNERGQTEYEVTWNLKQLTQAGNFLTRLFKGKSKAIESTNVYTGQNRDDTVYFNIKLSDKSSGNYEITVTVKDRLSGQEASRSDQFTIQ
jgi:Flp pilus assembly protein TadD